MKKIDTKSPLEKISTKLNRIHRTRDTINQEETIASEIGADFDSPLWSFLERFHDREG